MPVVKVLPTNAKCVVDRYVTEFMDRFRRIHHE
jgi:hypothetical protein